MEILHIKQLPDGQPILTIRVGNEIKKYTLCDDSCWYDYPSYEVITDDILRARLTENTETIYRENLIHGCV